MAGLTVLSCGKGPSASLTRVDPLEKLLPDMTWARPYAEVEEVAAGEHATFQFALRGVEDLKDVRLTVEAPDDGAGHKLAVARAGFVDYVHVGRATPDPARDAIRSTSGLFPDPIVDDAVRTVPGGMMQPLWVTIAIPEDAVPGLYKGSVRVSGRGFDRRAEIAVKVYPVVLEEPTLWATNWFRSGEDALHYFDPDAEMYSDGYWDFIRALAAEMKVCRQNTVMIPLSTIETEREGETWHFDFSHFDTMVDIFREAGVLKMLEASHIGGRIGYWSSPFGVRVPGREGFVPIEDPEARDFYGQFIPALMAHLREKGWDSIYCQHIADEPTGDNYASYIAIARYVKQLAPEIKIIEACHSHDLANVVDIWVPQLNFYADGYAFYRERQAAGDEVWFYTCLAPQGNYANRFLEQPLLKTRLLHWINFRYGATGYLHWGLNAWRGDPWQEASGINTESGNVLPGGDYCLVYPGDRRLYGSIRQEAMRDGIADYTLLQMLSRKDEALARELCRQTVYGWTTYDMSPAHFRATRRAILEALAEE